MSKSKITGLDDVLKEFDNKIGIEKIEKNMAKACAIVEKAAKENAKKGRTGELRRTISSEVVIEGEEVIGKVFSPLEYAPYVEYGTGLFAEEGGRKDVPWNYQDEEGNWHTTSGMQPMPFLRPALYDNRLKIIMKLQEGLLDND